MHWLIDVFVSVVVFVQSIVGGGQTVTPVVTSNVVVSTTTQAVGGVGSVNVKTSTKVVQDGVESTPVESQGQTTLPETTQPPVVNIQVPSVVVQQSHQTNTTQQPEVVAVETKPACSAQPTIALHGHEENPVTINGRWDHASSSRVTVDSIWLYSPCKDQKWFVDFVAPEGLDSDAYLFTSKNIPLHFNGTPESGKYAGLGSYVLTDAQSPRFVTSINGSYTFTIVAHSPDDPTSTSTKNVIINFPTCGQWECR